MQIELVISKLNQIILGVLLTWPALCLAGDGLDMKIEKLEGGYSVRVPNEIKITHISPVEDFVLYSMSNSHGKVLLQIYIGNHPKVFAEHAGHIAQSTKLVGGFPATLRQWLCDKKLSCGDVRIQLLDGEGWPSFAHMSYKNLSRSELAIIQEIIASFTKGQPSGADRE